MSDQSVNNTSLPARVLQHKNKILVGVLVLVLVKNHTLRKDNSRLMKEVKQADKIVSDSIALIETASKSFHDQSLMGRYFG